MCIMYEGWGGKGPCVLCMRMCIMYEGWGGKGVLCMRSGRERSMCIMYEEWEGKVHVYYV